MISCNPVTFARGCRCADSRRLYADWVQVGINRWHSHVSWQRSFTARPESTNASADNAQASGHEKTCGKRLVKMGSKRPSAISSSVIHCVQTAALLALENRAFVDGEIMAR